jgi:prepilin-type N-terminal cleavage/methylation domain-containing protein
MFAAGPWAHALPRPGRSAASVRSGGFTLIELVIVITLIGALAVVALPRMIDTTFWRLKAFGDDMRSQTQYHQRLALAQRRPVVASISPTGVSFDYAAGGNLSTLACPASATPCIAEAGTRSVTFNDGNQGHAVTSTGSALTVTVLGGTYSQAFQIEAETGVIRQLP